MTYYVTFSSKRVAFRAYYTMVICKHKVPAMGVTGYREIYCITAFFGGAEFSWFGLGEYFTEITVHQACAHMDANYTEPTEPSEVRISTCTFTSWYLMGAQQKGEACRLDTVLNPQVSKYIHF